MKTLIMYYSYTGNCRKKAAELEKETENSVVAEIKEKKRLGKIGTFMINCPKAALRKAVKIQDLMIDLKNYDKLIIIAPIWNGYPAPAFNSIVKLLPSDKEVEIYMCSGGGESPKSKQGTCNLIQKAGCKLTGYHDVQTTGIISK